MSDKKQMYWFYKASKVKLIEIDDKFNYFFFEPTMLKLKLHEGSVLLYLFWYLFTFGRYRVFYVVERKTNKIAHFSNIIPKIFKYSFMKKEDLFIVNCYTDPLFRGCRLYPFALSYIAKSLGNQVIWGGVRIDNVPSIKGLEKAGFKKVINVYKSRLLGVYYSLDE